MKALLLLLVCSGIAYAGPLSSQDPESAVVLRTRDTPWRITAGPQWRQFGDVQFSNSSQAPAYILPRLSSSGSSTGAVSYGDGFVLPDISGSSTSTWNFGYTSSSQLQGGDLVFHGSATRIEQHSFHELHDTDWSDQADGFGGFIQIESPELLRFHSLSLSAEVGYSFARSDSSQSATAFTATQRTVERRLNITDRYATNGAIIPPAPFSGSFNGPGPIIDLNATRTLNNGRVLSMEDHSVESIIHNKLRVDLHTFSFGPHAAMEFGALRVSLSAGFALNIADTEASTREVLKTTAGKTLKTWAHESNDTELLPGFYLEASAERPLSARCSLFVAARYDWAEKLEGQVGASRYSLDTGGLTAKVGISFKF